MEQLLKEIKQVIQENKSHLASMPPKDRSAWVLLCIANSPAFRESCPKSEEFLTDKDATLGYIYMVGILIKKLLKEEGL